MGEKKKLVEEMFDKGILVSEDFLEQELNNSVINKIEMENDLIVLNSDYVNVIKQQTSLVDWHELDRLKVEAETERNDDLYQNELQQLKKTNLILKTPKFSQEQQITNIETEVESDQLGKINLTHHETSNKEKEQEIPALLNSTSSPVFNFDNKVEIVISYKNMAHKYKIQDFSNIFVSRYRYMESILRNRQELHGTLTINRVLGKKEKETVSIIGLVEEIGQTKTGHLMITLEDLTGKIKVLISKNNKELFESAKDLVFDEVIGISGTSGDKIVFANKIIWPDIPETNELKKSEEEHYAIFLSDIHVGSNVFLQEEFEKFLRWINSQVGNEKQKELAKKVKYILIAGDLVDGIGIYPGQEEELTIKNIVHQYEAFAKLIKQVPNDKQIIICPGNHDLVHLAEPQPVFYKEYVSCLHDIPNITLVSNPALVNIAKTKTFSGFEVLMYHGYSFDYYVANVESIRNNGGYNRADLIMQFLLKKRHLAPSFKSTPYFPAHKEDPLLIKKIPDFFLTGHIHYSKVANYKGVTMISGSCWQAKTSFQEKLGHEPEPARVPLVNLKTREIKILKFV